MEGSPKNRSASPPRSPSHHATLSQHIRPNCAFTKELSPQEQYYVSSLSQALSSVPGVIKHVCLFNIC